MEKKETRESLIEKVKGIIAAPSCYKELKRIGEEYLAAVGSTEEKAAAEKLIAELSADVMPIDDVLAFFESAEGKKFFEEERANELAVHAREVKAGGGKFCDCPACAQGKAVLDNRELLLG